MKYGKVRNSFWAPDYRHKSAWQTELRKVAVFILDPRGLVSSISQSHFGKAVSACSTADKKQIENHAASVLSLLHPASWIQSLDLMDGNILYGLADFDAADRASEAEYWAAKSRQGNHLVNMRRRILRSQALNREILEHQPLTIAPEDGLIDVRFKTLPIREAALSLGARMVYDEGHQSDIPRLLSNQQDKEILLSPVARHYRLPAIEVHSIREANSKGNELVQLADFSAGLAAEMFLDARKRSELVQIFADVYVNGISMRD